MIASLRSRSASQNPETSKNGLALRLPKACMLRTSSEADCHYGHAGATSLAGLADGPDLRGEWFAAAMPSAAAFGQTRQHPTAPSQWQSRDWSGASPERIISPRKALTEEVRSISSFTALRSCGVVGFLRPAHVFCAAPEARHRRDLRRTTVRSIEAFWAPAELRLPTAVSGSHSCSPPGTRLSTPRRNTCRMGTRGYQATSSMARYPRHDSATMALRSYHVAMAGWEAAGTCFLLMPPTAGLVAMGPLS